MTAGDCFTNKGPSRCLNQLGNSAEQISKIAHRESYIPRIDLRFMILDVRCAIFSLCRGSHRMTRKMRIDVLRNKPSSHPMTARP